MGSIKSKASSYFITKSQLQKAADGVVEGGSLLQGHGRPCWIYLTFMHNE